MPELTVTVEVTWPKQPTLAAAERTTFKALMVGGWDLLKQAFRLLEDRLLADGSGARHRRIAERSAYTSFFLSNGSRA